MKLNLVALGAVAASTATVGALPAQSQPQSIFGGLLDAITGGRASADKDGAAPAFFPHHGMPEPPKTIDLSKYTIGQILNWTLHHPECGHDHEHRHELSEGGGHRHTLPLHKLAWAVNKTNDAKNYFNDPTIEATLFAPSDFGLRPPKHRHGRHGHNIMHQSFDGVDIQEEEDADRVRQDHPFNSLEFIEGLEEDHSDSDRHARFVRILELILKYHTNGDKAYTGRELADFATVPTMLNTSRESGVAFRIRTEPKLFPVPSLVLNFYARTRVSVKAANGIIHIISAPLLPPLGPLGELLLFPGAFSTLTSGVEKIMIDAHKAREHEHEHHDSLSATATDKLNEVSDVVMEVLRELVDEAMLSPIDADMEAAAAALNAPPAAVRKEMTVFAPTNLAFLKLGWKLNAFLFSPFGKRALKYVLAYHTIPSFTIHSDYIHNGTVKIQDGDLIREPVTYEMTDDMQAAFHSTLDSVGLREHQEALSAAGFLPHSPLFEKPPHHGPGGGREMPHPHWPHPPHGKANVTEYVFKTLNNASLPLDIITFRRGFGKGPIGRKIVLKPQGRDAKPVPVIVADAVAWSGAIHVIPTVLKPPRPHHDCPKKKAALAAAGAAEHEAFESFFDELDM